MATINRDNLTPALRNYLEKKEREEAKKNESEKTPLMKYMDKAKESGTLLSSADRREDEDMEAFVRRTKIEQKARESERKARDAQYEKAKPGISFDRASDAVKAMAFARNMPQPTAADRLRNREGVKYTAPQTSVDFTAAAPKNGYQAVANALGRSDLARAKQEEAGKKAQSERIAAARPMEQIYGDLDRLNARREAFEKTEAANDIADAINDLNMREQKELLEANRDTKKSQAEVDAIRADIQKKYADLRKELENSGEYEELNREKRLLEQELRDSYSKIGSEGDFEQFSRYSTTANSEEHRPIITQSGVFAGTTGYDDWVYEYINKNPEMLMAERNSRLSETDAASVMGYDLSYLQSMTDEEIGIYNYLYAKGGKEKAEEYLDALQSDLYTRQRSDSETRYASFAKEHPVLASAASVASGAARGAAYAGQLVDYLGDGEIDPNASYNAPVYGTNAVRMAVSDQIQKKWGPVGSFAYQTAMSMGDFLTASGMTAGTPLALLIMGSGAAADTTMSALERGVDSGSALALGAVAGAAEALTEKISMDALFKGDWDKKAIRYIFKNAFSEGTEEVMSDVINTFADVLIAGDKSEWKHSVAAYMEQGLDEKEAFKKAFLDKMQEIGLDFLGGALSGTVMSGTGVAVNRIGTAAAKSDVKFRQFEKLREGLIEDIDARLQKAADAEDGGVMLPTADAPGESASGGEIVSGLDEPKEIRAKTYDETVLDKKIAEAGTASEKSGLRLGVSQDRIETAKVLSERTGRDVVFYSDTSEQGKKIDGYYDPSSGNIMLNKDAASGKAVAVVLGHELTHTLEQTQAYAELDEMVFESILREGKNPETERANIADLYGRAGITLSDEAIDAEIVAKYVEKNLLNNKAAIRELMRTKPSLVRQIRRRLDRIAMQLAGTESLMDMQTLEAAVKIYRDAEKELMKEEFAAAAPVKTVSADDVTVAKEETAAETTVQSGDDVNARTAPTAKPTAARETVAEEKDSSEAVKRASDEPLASGWDEYLEEIEAQYEAGEITEEERDEAYSYVEEARDTGVPFDRASVKIEDIEGKIPAFVRKVKEAVTGKTEADVKAGKPVSGEQELKFSISLDEEFMDSADRLNTAMRRVPVNVMADARAARAEIKRIFEDPEKVDLLNLPPENIGNTYIPNGSYDGTEENTTVCIRSLAADALMDAVAEHLGRPLTVEDTITVSQEYWRYTDQPECLYCYVAMDRKAYREFLGSYLKQRDDAIANIRNGMSREEAYKAFLDGRKDTKPQKARFDMWLKNDQNGAAVITEADLASDAAMKEAVARDPSLEAQINDARKYAQGASWAKKRIGYTAYNNHILGWNPERIRNLNSQYGLRMYSFSDFSPAFILENMQMITDASVRGLKMLGYTKDINFAKIFAPSGININISTFAYEQDGEYVQDGMQGADWAEAQKLRDQYGNVGITFVAVNDAQVEWAISQDWIDVVIPFHLVRTGSKVAEHFGWTNYTQMSSDVKSEGWKKGDKKSIYPAEHQNDKETYLAALERNHLKPRFEKWIGHPNYMKLVNETRLSANDTPAVQPKFDMDAAKAAIDEMAKRGGYYVPVGRTDENMHEIAGEIADKIRADERQYSVSDEEYMSAVESGDTETAQRMVDEAAKNAGYVIKAYHGTTADFFAFDKHRVGKGNDQYGAGFYFASDKSASEHYGGRVIDVALRMEKPFVISSTNLLDSGITFTEEQAYEIIKRHPMIYDPEESPLGDYYDSYWEDGAEDWMIEDLARQYTELGYLDSDLFRHYPNELHEAVRDVTGYDGIIVNFRNGDKFYVAWFDNQMKSVDPVTYDDNGNVIPLADRFKESNNDIRYSVSDEEPKRLSTFLPTQAMTRLKKGEDAFAKTLANTFVERGNGVRDGEFVKEISGKLRSMASEYIKYGTAPDAALDEMFRQYNTAETPEAEAWQFSAFERAAKEFQSTLDVVKRFSDSRAVPEEKTEKENREFSTEEAEKLFEAQRNARKVLDRVKARALLTEEDKLVMGKIRRGEKSVEQLAPAMYNVEDIREVLEAQSAFDEADKQVKLYQKAIKAGYLTEAEDALSDIADWTDKAQPLAYWRETIDRNFRDIIKDEEKANEFIRHYIKPIHKAEADRQRMLKDYRGRVKALNLNEKPAEGEKVSESYAVQLLGEAEDNIRILEKMRKPDAVRDGRTLDEWRSVIETMWTENPSLDQAKIRDGVEAFRVIYDELLKQMNEVLLRNGYAPVRYRSGYFPHFTAGSEDSVLAKFGRIFGIRLEVNPLPTSINGLTQDFKPGKAWFSHALERTGFETAYDAVAGFEQYIGGVSDVIHHTDNIQRLRALTSQIRWLSADEGLRQQVQKIENDEDLSEEQKQSLKSELFEKGRYRMSNLAVYLDEYTNRLANKKNRIDRGMEQLIGRKAYTVMNNLESRVAANMIGFNIGSALTNIIPLNQAQALIGPKYTLRGMWDALQNLKNNDGLAAQSDFLASRRGSDRLGLTGVEKFSNIAGMPMELVDNIVSEAIVRAAYLKNLESGMSEDAALEDADAVAASLIADRSKGALPLIFDVKNPFVKLLTQFQVEVNNEFSVIFKDIPKAFKEKGLAKLAAVLLQYFLGAKIFNDLYEKALGRRPAFDPLEMVNDAVGGLTGYQLPNVLDIFEPEAWNPGRENPADVITDLGTAALESLPFVGGVLGGGRVPIQSALPDVGNVIDAVADNTWSAKRRINTLATELLKPAAYLVPPAAGGLMKKALGTTAAAIRGGVYGVQDVVQDDGSVVGEDVLKYPFYRGSAGEFALNTARSLMSGTSTTTGGAEWVESGFKGLSRNETQAYELMLDAGEDQHAAWDLLQSMKKAEADKAAGISKNKAAKKILRESGISDEAKAAVYTIMYASDLNKELIANASNEKYAVKTALALMDISDIPAGVNSKTAEICRIIADADLDYRTALSIYEKEVSEKHDDKISSVMAAGMTFDDYLRARSKYAALDNSGGNNLDKTADMMKWIDRNYKKEAHRAVLQDVFDFRSAIMMPASESSVVKNYKAMIESGMSEDRAYEVASAVSALEPLEGKSTVSAAQRARAVLDTVSDDEERASALAAVLKDDYKKYGIAHDLGVGFDVYTSFRETLPSYDADGNSSYSQAEIVNAIESLTGAISPEEMIALLMSGQSIPSGTALTDAHKAVLWQLATGSESAKNNPYSTSAGNKVIEMLGRAE